MGTVVEDIMTPRTVVLMLSKDLTVKETIDKHEPLRFSRMPIYDKDIDDVVGVVQRVNIYEKIGDDEPGCSLEAIARPLHSVPEAANWPPPALASSSAR